MAARGASSRHLIGIPEGNSDTDIESQYYQYEDNDEQKEKCGFLSRVISPSLGGSWDAASPTNKFEEEAARSSFISQIWYLVVELAGMIIYAMLRPGRPWPVNRVYLWPAGCISIGLRSVSLLMQWRIPRSRHMLALICLLVDVALLTSCHPNASTSVWWGEDELMKPHIIPVQLYFPDTPRARPSHEESADEEVQALLNPGERAKVYVNPKNLTMTDLQKSIDEMAEGQKNYKKEYLMYEQQLENHKKHLNQEFTMVVYSLQILVWYATVFMLLMRQAIVAVPVSFLVYCIGASGLWKVDILSDEHTLLELVLLGFSMAVAIITKKKLEASQREVFKLSEDLRREMIKERVRRYEAEFAQEQLQGGGSLVPQSKIGAGPPSVASSRPSSMAARSCFADSVKSAPAALCEVTRSCGATRRSGECLPPDAVVWVEGSALPQAVRDVLPGQRVLCYDSLALCPKYVDVLDSKYLVGDASWVVVKLADGTSLTLTADHPTQPRRAYLPEGHVPAAELRPGSDSLMVLKMMPVEVASVDADVNGEEKGAGAERIALALRHPDRHEVFVNTDAGGTNGPHMASIAVGSADAATRTGLEAGAGGEGIGLTVRRTFIDIDEEAHGSAHRRSSSAPPSLWHHDAASKKARKRLGPKTALEKHAEDMEAKRSPMRLRRTNSDSDVTSNRSSSRMSSSSVGDAEVLVAVADPEGAACVSELLSVRRAGLLSRGSEAHEDGTCNVCVFQNRWQNGHGQKCFKGFLCDRCHVQHDKVRTTKRPSGAMRKWRARNAAKEKAESLSGGDDILLLE